MPDVQNLEEFVNTVTKNITQGIPDGYHLKDDIEIELVVVSTKGAGGKFNILVAEAGGKYQKEELSKIKFKIAKTVEGYSAIVKGGF